MSEIDEIKDPQRLCLELLNADSEEEVTAILEENGLLNENLWQDLGDDENNYAIIGNQMSSPTAALVEKIINSIDAVLLAKCHIAKVNPVSANAPQSMSEAAERFLGVKNGSLLNLDSTERSKLAEESIWMIATGANDRPCYTFVDFGEGQTPKRMPNTFLTLFKQSRKIRIPFVQGRFQMGGTGVLRFCGSKKYQLIISRRHPDIAETENEDATAKLWGFSIVRRVPREGVRSSVYRYLAPNKSVPCFSAESLPLLPSKGKGAKSFVRLAKWGTCIKLYNYQFDVPALKTNIKLDLSRELDRHLVNMPIPVRLCECRNYEQASPYSTLSGLGVRLAENKEKALEKQFPNSALLSIPDLGEIPVQIFLFQRNAGHRFISKQTGVLFTLNGQTHGSFPSAFFLRQSIQLDYLKDDLLVIADCTQLPGASRDDLFMSSRDRLSEGPMKKHLEEQMEVLLHNHSGLLNANKERELEASKDSLKDSLLLEKLIDKMLSFTPSLASFFATGERLTSPELNGGKDLSFEGKKFPTYFRILNEPQTGLEKECPINGRCAVAFETDVENQYFARASDPGHLIVTPNEAKTGMLLWNGRGILFLKTPDGTHVGNKIAISTEISDSEHNKPFFSGFQLLITGPIEKTKKEKSLGKRKKKSRQLALPNIQKVTKDQWSNHGFDNGSAIEILGSTIFVNIDNVYLVTEKSRSKTHPMILEEQYVNGLVIASLAMRHDFNERKRKGQIQIEEADIRERIEGCTRGLSAVILPMIQQLDTLKLKRGSLHREED